MTVRAALAITEPDDDGITVEAAARIIGVDQTTVRELVRTGQLEAWRAGKSKKPTGIRISRTDCYEYRQRNRICAVASDADVPPPKKRPRPSRTTAIYNQTLASLRAKGFRI
jgi:excisionase family DNA binding protein